MCTLIYASFVEHAALSDVPGLRLCREDVNAFVTVWLLLMDEGTVIRRWRPRTPGLFTHRACSALSTSKEELGDIWIFVSNVDLFATTCIHRVTFKQLKGYHMNTQSPLRCHPALSLLFQPPGKPWMLSPAPPYLEGGDQQTGVCLLEHTWHTTL